MISTKSLISSIHDVPREWVFENYLILGEKLTGQDVRIKSPFSMDRNPSLYVYFSCGGRCYKFKDFSTGKMGDGVELVQHLFKLSTRGESAHMIIRDYNKFVLTNKEEIGIREFKVRQRYKVSEFEVRGWNTLDQRYWMQYRIGSRLLGFYNVRPLSYYKMFKEENGKLFELTINGNYIYGYFRTDGTLYKIYQPYVKENKFIKVKDYIQGSDQLTMTKPYLVICSSLKDIMGFTLLRYKNAEAVAPDSENSIIPISVMAAYGYKYVANCTLFDNDIAGVNAMNKYHDLYKTPGIILPMSKDLSDSIRDYDIPPVREQLTPLLRTALKIAV